MKTLITGTNGLVGSALKRMAPKTSDLVCVTRQDADLTKEEDVIQLFKKHKPDIVIHTAAKVGGVLGNLTGQGEYFHQNILMNAHIIHHSYLNDVKKLIVFSSVCVFPDGLPCLREDLMHKGEPFAGNFAYAYAKRMVDIQIQAYRDQYKIKNYCSVIPGNVMGKQDLYNLVHGHVLPCLIHKIYLAKKNNMPLKVWGDGSAIREFIYSDDLARWIYQILELNDIPQRILMCGEEQFSIKEIVNKLCTVANFNGEIIWETDKPNGQKARLSDLSLLRSLIGDLHSTNIDEALKQSYEWFVNNYEVARK